MGKIKVSLITTVLNEESSIEHFLSSIAIQSQKPNEVIIVDAGSTDKTVDIIKSFQPFLKNLKILVKKGANRSAGRNLAIKSAKNEIIVMSDAGCRLDKEWVKEISRQFVDKKIKVVAGFYLAESKTVFQKCVAPYALVMPDRVNPKNFLPSSRSMAIRKTVWKKSGGFPENYSDNEDFVYAHILKRKKINTFFARKAVVYWFPRKNIMQFWTMIYRFARGDAKAGLRRVKIASIFLRYVGFIFLGLLCLIFNDLLILFVLTIFCYIFWSVFKNYKYVKDLRAIFLLPFLQLISDFSVILGSIVGGLGSG
ncbi:hypothetical protein CO010_02615 [Candidatus Shapirobacteria bacterium CG_4_8_14_3_um_filter_39_11]|uniref:Glycosyltransferase 2-like domain-containing protein n=1 Tax=Candidatus Shapirobacteria bacterium CG_4_8_14_3_um_filter_39_11 TaxID=1974875 RepID=A0A2M8GGG4_9BACT|nr:MAG: hypothetical protein CO010_02615 [Candidatus Shapirobacteria bacterium CG_4_8_14_3_um_filter_39_11]